MRTVICHYHIFKNSGTSFDKLLEANFGEQHCEFDGPFAYFKINQDELAKIIQQNRKISYSSHQINLPVPTSLDFNVEPVIFIRHPLLRLRSIYNFGKQSPDATVSGGIVLETTFSEWLQSCLKDNSSLATLSNAQTRFVSAVYGRAGLQRKTQSGALKFDLNQAFRNLDHVKLLGRTEFFDIDVPKFENILKEQGINFTYQKLDPSNTTSSDLSQTLESRLENIQNELGEELYTSLLDYNKQDIELFDYATERLKDS